LLAPAAALALVRWTVAVANFSEGATSSGHGQVRNSRQPAGFFCSAAGLDVATGSRGTMHHRPRNRR
jgi:hypothetical protein